MDVVKQAASLGLDSQVRALLHGDLFDRALAADIVRGALAAVDERAKVAAKYVANCMGGSPPEGR